MCISDRLIPSIDMSEGMGKFAFLPAAIGFIFGILFLLLMDKIIPHLHMNEDKPEGLPSHLKKTTMLVLAVTLHNIPEGMAVGVVFAGLLSGNNGITLAGAFSLSIGCLLYTSLRTVDHRLTDDGSVLEHIL